MKFLRIFNFEVYFLSDGSFHGPNIFIVSRARFLQLNHKGVHILRKKVNLYPNPLLYGKKKKTIKTKTSCTTYSSFTHHFYSTTNEALRILITFILYSSATGDIFPNS